MNYRKLVLLIAIGFMPLSNQQVAAEELSAEAQELIDFISVCRYKSIGVEPNVQEALCNGPHAPQGSWSATDGLECPSFPYKTNWCVIDEEATENSIQAINGTLATQADVDAAYADGAASVTPEDGIGPSDVDAAYEDGLAAGAASVTPEDGSSDHPWKSYNCWQAAFCWRSNQLHGHGLPKSTAGPATNEQCTKVQGHEWNGSATWQGWRFGVKAAEEYSADFVAYPNADRNYLIYPGYLCEAE